jgi:hypothetical protein
MYDLLHVRLASRPFKGFCTTMELIKRVDSTLQRACSQSRAITLKTKLFSTTSTKGWKLLDNLRGIVLVELFASSDIGLATASEVRLIICTYSYVFNNFMACKAVVHHLHQLWIHIQRNYLQVLFRDLCCFCQQLLLTLDKIIYKD